MTLFYEKGRAFGLIVALAAALRPIAAPAQTLPPTDPKTLSAPTQISLEDRANFYKSAKDAARKFYPRIIFIPGILGSKIEECDDDKTNCNSVWGTKEALEHQVDLTIKKERKYRYDYVDDLFFVDFYGGIVRFLKDTAHHNAGYEDNGLVTKFAYDWRESSEDNAKILAATICDIRAGAPQSPIYILAHSMGGLVAKAWAAHHAQTACKEGLPHVKEIAFVATPHLGAPKAVKAFVVGYNAYFDEIDVIHQNNVAWGFLKYVAGFVERNYVLEALNSAGVTFSSLYELLPLRSSAYCLSKIDWLKKAPNPLGADSSEVNVFWPPNWRKFGLLQRMPSGARDVIYEKELPEKLEKSEVFMCEMAKFDPTTAVDRVDYVYGVKKAAQTFGSFNLSLAHPGALDVGVYADGDGTVPA